MSLHLTKISYAKLNAKQKENYNFQKVSAVLADYGFVTIKLSDDWQGADFIAQHVDGETFLKIQLKGRLMFDKKYIGKNLHIAFFEDEDWYLYPHDQMLEIILEHTNISNTKSWIEGGAYSFPSMGRQLTQLFAPFKITGDVIPIDQDNAS